MVTSPQDTVLQVSAEIDALPPEQGTDLASARPDFVEKDPPVQTPTAPGFYHQELLRDLRSLPIPGSIPARFTNRFPKTGLKEVDWLRQFRRKLYVLYLLSRGMDIRLEIDHLISQVEGIGSRTGALRRIYDNMAEKNLITISVMEMSAPNTSLAMLRLTEDGKEFNKLMGWESVESERERLNRLHEGQQYPQHTLAVLIFAMHARLRGQRVCVLPEVTSMSTHAVPDVWVGLPGMTDGSESVYVEVELSNKELPEKWQNLSQLQGRVALCARNLQRRARLVGDCKLKNLHGVATDLESLISVKVPEITLSTPLWMDAW